MCYRNEYHFRCGHTRRTAILHCSTAKFNNRTSRWNKCARKTGIIAIPRDDLCGKPFCPLTAYGGRYICCECHFGYKPGEENKWRICAKGGCSHVVCWTCEIRNEENVRAMYEREDSVDEDEVEESINEDTSMDSIVFEPSEEEEEEEEDDENEYAYEEEE